MRKTMILAPRGAVLMLAALAVLAPAAFAQDRATFGAFKKMPERAQVHYVDFVMQGIEVAFLETAGTWPSAMANTFNGCKLWYTEVHAALLKKTGPAFDTVRTRNLVFDTYLEECAAQKRAQTRAPSRK